MRAVTTATELGARIRHARASRRRDQAWLAARIDLDRSAISKIESGARGVSALELTRIAAALDLTVPDLVYLPSEPALAARPQLTDEASPQEGERFTAEVMLDRLLRDAEQLHDLGLLPVVDHGLQARQWSSHDDAVQLAAEAREYLGVGDRPLPAMADVCGRFGLWVEPVAAAIDGLSATPEPGFGAAVVGEDLDPGRRRATAAHELGHHLAGDTYATDVSVSASTDERERLVDAFAGALLLPISVVRSRLGERSGADARDELIRISAEYRVSWSLALTACRLGDLDSPSADPPLDPDFLEAYGARPEPDLMPGTMAREWVRACRRAEESDAITSVRATEMLRGARDARR